MSKEDERFGFEEHCGKVDFNGERITKLENELTEISHKLEVAESCNAHTHGRITNFVERLIQLEKEHEIHEGDIDKLHDALINVFERIEKLEVLVIKMSEIMCGGKK